jgi:hypothetical protein
MLEYRKDGIKINSLISQNYKTNRNIGFIYKYLILTNEEIIKFCEGKLAPYKVPKLVEFRNSIPKSTAGKFLCMVLREEEVAKIKTEKVVKPSNAGNTYFLDIKEWTSYTYVIINQCRLSK